MTSPDLSTDPSTPDDTLVSRLRMLQQNHPWMDPNVSTTLAASPTSNSDLASIADGLKKQVQQTWDGISHFFDDPVLQKQPTTSLVLQRYITGALGPSPVSDESLTHIQTSLQAKGFGANLPITGVWDAGWQAALSAHAQEEYNQQIAGNKPGSVSTHGFLHSLMSSLTPSGIASAVTGFVKSIPADVGSLGADLWGSVSGIPDSILHPGEFSTKAGQAKVNQRIVDADNTLGVNKYRQAIGQAPVTAQNYDPIGSGINDLGTLFLVSGAGGALKAGQVGVKGALAEGLTKDAAIRGPGIVAKSLIKPVGQRMIVGGVVGGGVGAAQAAARGTSISEGTGQGVASGLLTGALFRAGEKKGLIPERAYDNIPVLKNTGPILGKLTDADGLYYRTRTRLATPYQYGPVRAAGLVSSQAQTFALKANAVSYLESKFGNDQANIIQQSIEGSHPLDAINDSIAGKLGFTVAGVHFKPDLDYLTYVLHGPTTVGAAGTVSRSVRDTGDALASGFNRIGATGQIEQATGQSYDKLVKMAGGDPNRLHVWMSNKVKDAAAHMVAEEGLGKFPPQTLKDMTPDDKYQFLREQAAAVRNDDTATKDAVGRMMLGNPEYLQTHIKGQILASKSKPSTYLKGELNEYLDAGDTLTHKVLPFKDTHLLTPQDRSFIEPGVDPKLFPQGLPTDLRNTVKVMAKGEVPAGNIGLAKDTTLTSQKAGEDLKEFQAGLEEAGSDPELLRHWHETANQYLFHNYAQDAHKLMAFEGQPDKVINFLADRAKDLAAEVHLPADAPQELKDAFDHIASKGYRVVVGKDIGHAYRADLPPLKDLGEPLTRARKIASGMGLNTQLFSHVDYGVDRRLRISSALQDRVEAGKLNLPAHYTVQTVLNDLQDDKIVGKELPYFAHAAFQLSRRFHADAADQLVKMGQANDVPAAMALLESQMAAASGLRQLRYSDVKKVLGRETDGVPLMDEESIKHVYTALQQGFSQTPAYMLGAQKMEDFLRYLPFKTNEKLLGGHLPLGAVALPTRLAAMRDTFRFNLSPFFSLRRIAKTNVKMGIDGVTPTLSPVSHLRTSGTWDAAHIELDRLQGDSTGKYKYLDEADRYLDSKDVFGLYNPRHYEAYYVQQKQLAGATDSEIRDGLVRVFQYGKDGREGRTALERTTNVIFFPFSFEKTVMRNVGSYLLDKPAQAMVLDNALSAYADFNNTHKDNPLATAWIEAHAPLLSEALRLNTFAHGFSMGEAGGVNRPLLNAFMPQSWATDKDTAKTLSRFVPAVADLHRIVNEGTDQTTIIHTALQNGLATIEGKPSGGILNGRPVAETAFAQRNNAKQFRSELVHDFQSVLDYNDSVGTDEEKYHFGYGKNIPDNMHGAVINKTNIGFIVQHQYPTYDPLSGAAYAIANKAKAQQFVNSYPDPKLRAQYQDFYAKAETAITHLNKDEYPIDQAAQVQDLFRQAATDFAEKDPRFLKFYDSTFATTFGPLRAVQQ